MAQYKKQKAQDRKCIFADLVETYNEVGLSFCETEDRKWWNADGPKAAERLTLFRTYFPELANYPLESHSLCQTHYNQIVTSNRFYQHLLGLFDSVQESRLDTNMDIQTTSYADLRVELDNTKRILESAKQENTNLCNRIERLWQSFEEQEKELKELTEKLKQANEEVNTFRSLYDDQYEKNRVLINQWESRFSSRKKRIDAVIEIAKAERELLFDDINLLIRSSNRFSLESLMKYNPREWLDRRNQVAVKFVETLVQNNQVTDSSSQEKLFKIVVAINSIYGARHGKYVSEIQLAASAIKYSIARSKMVINIDSHITSSGSYYRFQKWLEELSKHEEPLPKGLLFLAFDNEQKGQKNYLDRGFNTVIYHIVTSFIAFNMASQNKIQHTNSPWACNFPSRSQYEELFDISPKMQEVIDEELYSYLAEVLILLSEEKSSTNIIDSLAASISINVTKMKFCPSCNLQNIENRKKNCPNCGTQLPTLAEIQKEKTDEIENNINKQLSNQLIFKQYRIDDEQDDTSTPRISHTQRITDQGVNVPEIYIPDPINLNPNSITNVEQVRYATKLKEKFPWLVLIPGQLHEEMNMLRAYVELNWEIDLKRFAKCQGYRTENQLAYFKKCSDHHKSWDSVCVIYRQAMAMELLWPYVKNHPNPSVEGYLTWVKGQQDPLYYIKYEQTFVYLQAIVNYRKAIRINDPLLKRAAKRAFSPIWSARRHPIYQLIEVADEVQLMQLSPEICEIVERNCVVSRSGIYEQHQGLDAIIEEINKALKALIPPIPQDRHWKIAARNCKKFLKLRANLFNVIGYNDCQSSGPRTRPDSTVECQRFRALLRGFKFVSPENPRDICQSLGEEYELDKNLKNFTCLAKMARQEFIIETFINKTNSFQFRPIPITTQEADAQKNEQNMKKEDILFKIETLLEQLGESAKKKYSRIKSKSRKELLEILQEVKCLFDADHELNDQDCPENLETDQQEL